jgi:excisionase family DNA binding protein
MTGTHTYLAIGEVARAFGVTVPTVRNWDRDGKLKSIRTPGNQRRFAESDVEALLARSADWAPAS